jgi:hypothetical protein
MQKRNSFLVTGFIFSIAFLVILVFLLSTSKCIKKKTKSDFFGYRKNLAKVLLQLPKGISRKDYFIIIRFGSIEFSSDYCVLCIPKKNLDKKSINCFYYKLNNIEPISNNSSSDVEEVPRIIGYKLRLINNVRNINFNNLSSFTLNDIDNFVSSEMRHHLGEGIFANYYFVLTQNVSKIYILNKKSDVKIKKYFIHLFRQISPSEYLQTYSLLSSDTVDIYSKWIHLNQSNIRSNKFKLTYNINSVHQNMY